jgi:hypothetical protein
MAKHPGFLRMELKHLHILAAECGHVLCCTVPGAARGCRHSYRGAAKPLPLPVWERERERERERCRRGFRRV